VVEDGDGLGLAVGVVAESSHHLPRVPQAASADLAFAGAVDAGSADGGRRDGGCDAVGVARVSGLAVADSRKWAMRMPSRPSLSS